MGTVFCFIEHSFLVMSENNAITDKDPISEMQFDYNAQKVYDKEFSSRKKNTRTKGFLVILDFPIIVPQGQATVYILK